ncbi:hypothetical protein [Microvirga antarctica]|uniref:hypothetical protein n=1 Tax=Microvirga antarctica TaxID=2819233 RepID=UPI001B304C47|nr:hypothetical protein [Microvirga antarctica]
MPKPKKLPVRIQRIIEKCQRGAVLCRSNGREAAGPTDAVFFFEPTGERVQPKTAFQVLATGLLRPRGDGLFGAESSQTWEAHHDAPPV